MSDDEGEKVVLPGATKEQGKWLTEFKYWCSCWCLDRQLGAMPMRSSSRFETVIAVWAYPVAIPPCPLPSGRRGSGRQAGRDICRRQELRSSAVRHANRPSGD